MYRKAIIAVFCGLLLAAWNGAPNAEEKEKPKEKAKSVKLEIDKPAPDFALADMEGKEHNLSSFKGRYVVLEWINMDCPFVKKHYNSGNMQKLQKDYAKKGVAWFSICSSAPGNQGHFETAEIKKRLKESKGMQTAYLVDSEGTVGKMYGAKTTPLMFIIDPKGVLIFAGGIDDKRSTDVADVKGATNYVRECLDAALAGKTVKTKSAPPYGCSVKYKEKDKDA